MLIALFVGAAINLIVKKEKKNFLVYDYSKEDSLFNNSNLYGDEIDSIQKNIENGVDYQRELLDFRDEKLSEKSTKDTIGIININSASESELIKLPGIGKNLASEVIDYRTKNGGFKKIEDLLNIKGIGKAKFNKIKNRIIVK